jgi:copper(I)-binding protein
MAPVQDFPMSFVSARAASLFGALALAGLYSGPTIAENVKMGSLVIHAPWTRATPKGAPVAGGYLIIENTGDQPDRLVGGSFAASAGFAIHQMAMKEGVMSMAPVEGGLEIPAHGSVELGPGATHLMFLGLKQQLKQNDAVGGTLVFEKAGVVTVSYVVQAIGAKAPGHPAN